MSGVLVVIGVGGMGEAIARRVGAGKQIVLADFKESLLNDVAERLSREALEVHTHPVDVSSFDSVQELATMAARLGPVNQVAHTAGLSPVQAVARSILKVDLVGVSFSLEAFGEVIADGGAGVVIASMAGTMAAGRLPADWEQALARTSPDELMTLPFLHEGALSDAGAAYGLSKRANQLHVQAASLIWGARGARINSISPGVISTPMGLAELAGDSSAAIRAMVSASGTKRLGSVNDIAAAAEFLLGPDSTFITGTDLLVDGGVVAAVRSGAVADTSPA